MPKIFNCRLMPLIVDLGKQEIPNTFHYRLMCLLDDGWLSIEDSRAVLREYLVTDAGKKAEIYMQELVDDHRALFKEVWEGVKATTVQWIDKHCPNHEGRDVFLPEPQR